jgi:hypothetical protein
MLKTAVLDSTKQLRLEEEVSEAGTVDADVALLDDFSGGGLDGGGIERLVVVLFVVEELLLVDVGVFGFSHHE